MFLIRNFDIDQQKLFECGKTRMAPIYEMEMKVLLILKKLSKIFF
jgi:hypothetical protein